MRAPVYKRLLWWMTAPPMESRYMQYSASLPSQYLQVVIVTPTSKAEAMYMLPIEDWSTVTLIAGSSEVSSCYSKNIKQSFYTKCSTWDVGVWPLYCSWPLFRSGCSEGFHEIINRESFLQVMVNSSFTVSWSVPRASKNDKIGSYLWLIHTYVLLRLPVGLYSLYGRTDISRATNKQAATQGECQMKVTYPHSSFWKTDW